MAVFSLQPLPSYMQGDRHCRACDELTEWVLEAEGTMHKYPCCHPSDSSECSAEVKGQILESLRALDFKLKSL